MLRENGASTTHDQTVGEAQWDLFREETAMLVLSRKLGEKIVINGDIVVTVVKIDRNQIRLGIEAPKDVAIYRQEIAPAASADDYHQPAMSR
jgi:carbon storage regulator